MRMAASRWGFSHRCLAMRQPHFNVFVPGRRSPRVHTVVSSVHFFISLASVNNCQRGPLRFHGTCSHAEHEWSNAEFCRQACHPWLMLTLITINLPVIPLIYTAMKSSSTDERLISILAVIPRLFPANSLICNMYHSLQAEVGQFVLREPPSSDICIAQGLSS